MNMQHKLLATLPWAFAAIIVAGIVHIGSILAMPRLATEDAFARVARIAPLHRMIILSETPAGRKLLPFEDPATVLAVCRFDLRSGPLRLRGNLAGNGLTLMSFRNRFGTAFYAMNDRGTSRGDLNVIVVTSDQLEEIEANDPEDEIPAELRLVAPSLQGFILLRALAPEKGLYPAAMQSLRAIACQLEQPATEKSKPPAR